MHAITMRRRSAQAVCVCVCVCVCVSVCVCVCPCLCLCTYTQVLADQKRNVFSMKSGLTLGDFGWGSKTFAKMGREKIKLIRVFLELGVNVVISDVDVLWLRNPIPYFKEYPNADILTSSDHLTNTVPGYELEIMQQAGSAANIGECVTHSGISLYRMCACPTPICTWWARPALAAIAFVLQCDHPSGLCVCERVPMCVCGCVCA